MGNQHEPHHYITPGGLRREDRRENVLMVGKEVMTTAMLMTFAIEDILDGHSVVWVGSDSSSRRLLQYVPGDRVNDVIFFSPGSREDRRYPTAWNQLKNTPPDERYQVAEAITAAFGSIYKQFWGPQSALLLRSAAHANLDLGNSTLLGCLAMLSNERFRVMVRPRIKDPLVLAWWEEFERWPDQQKRAATAPLQNKLGPLLSAWPLRNILCQVKNKLAVDEVFNGKILIVELKATHLGSNEAVKLFGSLLLHDLIRAGFKQPSRTDPACYVYINNAAAFVPEVIEEFVIGAESTFSMALATTHLDRLQNDLEHSLMSASGTILASRSSYADAEKFYKHFGELRMKEREFVDLDWNQLAVKPWEGRPYWSTFNLFPHDQFAKYGKAHAIIARSLNRYGTPRAKIERKISAWQRRWLTGQPQSPSPFKRKH